MPETSGPNWSTAQQTNSLRGVLNHEDYGLLTVGIRQRAIGKHDLEVGETRLKSLKSSELKHDSRVGEGLRKVQSIGYAILCNARGTSPWLR